MSGNYDTYPEDIFLPSSPNLNSSLPDLIQSDDDTTFTPWIESFVIAESVLIPIVVVIFVANLFVVSSVAVLVIKHNGIGGKNSPLPIRRLTAGHVIVLNLSLADTLVGIAALALVLKDDLMTSAFDKMACLFHLGIMLVPCMASILSMAAIAVDRYLSIMHPLQYVLKVKIWEAILLVIGIWLVSCLVGFAPAMGWNAMDSYSYNQCYLTILVPKSYILFLVFGLFIPVLVSAFVLYYKVYKVSKSHARRIADTESSIGETSLKHYISTTSLNHLPQVYPINEIPIPTSGVTEHNNITDSGIDVDSCICKTCDKTTDSETEICSKHIITARKSLDIVHESAHRERYSKRTNSLHYPTTLSINPKVNVITTSKSMTDLQGHNKYRRTSSFGNFLHQVWHRLQFQENTLQRMNRKRREKKAFRTLGLVMGFFIGMWSPFLITTLVQSLMGEVCNFPSDLTRYLFLLGIANSAVNPLIYTYTNRDIRKYFCQCYCGCLAATESFDASSISHSSNQNSDNYLNQGELPGMIGSCTRYNCSTPRIVRTPASIMRTIPFQELTSVHSSEFIGTEM